MYDFTNSTGTIADTDLARERFAHMDDEKLLKTLEACAYLCSSGLSGRPPRQSFIIQRELVGLRFAGEGLRWNPFFG